MDRIRGWLTRRVDNNVVTYSRFGLPGDELDDRPPPTKIHVAAFDGEAPEFRVFRTHSTRAALASAGIGMSATIFVVLCVIFEFQWSTHERGFDVGALISLTVLLAIGLASNWQIAQGVRTGNPENLVPAIMIYTFLIIMEFVMVFLILNHIIALSVVYEFDKGKSHLVLFLVMFTATVMVQSCMLLSISKARNYLELKKTHEMEVQVAEHCKTENRGLEIVFVKKNERVDSNSNNTTATIDDFTSTPQSQVILSASDQIA